MRLFAGLVAGVIGGCLVATTGAGELKIAVVNASRLLKEYHKTELADAHIQEQVDDFSAERDKLLAEHRRLKKEFEDLRAEGESKALSEEARGKKKELAEGKLTEVMEYESNIRDMAVSRRKQLEDEGRRMHLRLLGEIHDVVANYAKTNGFTLVLDSSGQVASGFQAVMFADEAMDITEPLLKVLNANKPEGAAKPK